jgi:hypothetical protein
LIFFASICFWEKSCNSTARTDVKKNMGLILAFPTERRASDGRPTCSYYYVIKKYDSVIDTW